MDEYCAEQILWQWLKKYPNVYEVYFNRENGLKAPIFKIGGSSLEKPDFIISIRLFGRDEYIVAEIKNGEDSINVRQSDKILNKYYHNYINGITKYFIGDKEIKINRFIVATQYSPNGKLFKNNEIAVANETADINNKWVNKTVPRWEFVSTKGFGRDLIHKFKEYRNKIGLKEAPGIGWLISDVVQNFDGKELNIQSGMIGNPLIQGVFWNSKLNKWQQALIRI